MRIMTVGTSHHHATPLPAVHALAVAPVCPCLRLREMALGAKSVALVQTDAITGPKREHVHRVG